MAACQVIPAAERFAPSVIAFLDCQARTLGAQGYQALAAPGSPVSVMLTVMLTLFVAFIGYRMLFGHMPSVREGVLAAVKVGVVLAVATGWPAFRTIIYDVVLEEPAELASAIGAPAALPGAGGGLVERLDGADRALQTLAAFGAGQPPMRPEGQAVFPPVAPPMFGGFDAFALGASRVAFLGGAIGAFALLRIAAGLLLALGPLFIAFLLFDGTRGLFEGWVRALVGITLGAVATSILLGVELALLEPWLADLLSRRAANIAVVGAPEQLLAITSIFSLVLAGLLFVMGRVAFSWKLPVRWPEGVSSARSLEVGAGAAPASRTGTVPIENRSRAAVIADAVAASQQRDMRVVQSLAPARVSAQAGRSRDEIQTLKAEPLGQSFRRRTTLRISAGVRRRDGGS
jgi:type IV secretion system protein VirB6